MVNIMCSLIAVVVFHICCSQHVSQLYLQLCFFQNGSLPRLGLLALACADGMVHILR